jgi:hypothetical protein
MELFMQLEALALIMKEVAWAGYQQEQLTLVAVDHHIQIPHHRNLDKTD